MYLNTVLEVYTPDAQRIAKVRAAAAKLVLMLSSFCGSLPFKHLVLRIDFRKARPSSMTPI